MKNYFQHGDLKRNLTILIGILGQEIVLFVSSPFWLIVEIKLHVSIVFDEGMIVNTIVETNLTASEDSFWSQDLLSF